MPTNILPLIIVICGVLALIAIGYALIFGVLNLVHLAHGEVFMIGALRRSLVFTQARYRELAHTDPLTNLPNRRGFLDRIERYHRSSAASTGQVGFLMIDVDHVKHINDNYGHQAGDQVLQLVVAGGKSGLRQSDPLCRWGGEEFVAILSSCDAAGAIAAAEKFRSSAAALCAVELGKTVHLSAGVATMRPNEDFYTLIGRADEALLVAKKNGKDRTISAET